MSDAECNTVTWFLSLSKISLSSVSIGAPLRCGSLSGFPSQQILQVLSPLCPNWPHCYLLRQILSTCVLSLTQRWFLFILVGSPGFSPVWLSFGSIITFWFENSKETIIIFIFLLVFRRDVRNVWSRGSLITSENLPDPQSEPGWPGFCLLCGGCAAAAGTTWTWMPVHGRRPRVCLLPCTGSGRRCRARTHHSSSSSRLQHPGKTLASFCLHMVLRDVPMRAWDNKKY